jgi:hypothetical protein
LWYLLKHILASKFTYLFRGIPPGFTQPLVDCLTHLHCETCEILAQCETIPDISFDLARIREGAGLGYADDLLDSAFAASKIDSLRSIEQVNPGYLASVKAAFEAGTASCHDSAFPLPARQLASSLLAVDPTFLQDDYQGQDYSGLRKLQSAFLAPQKVVRTVVVEALLLRSNNIQNTIYQSGKSPEARAWLDAVPKTINCLDHVSFGISDSLSESVAHSASSAVGQCHLCLWSRCGRPRCPYPEVPARQSPY